MLFSIRQKIIFYTVIPVTLLYNLIFGVNLYQSVRLTTADVEQKMEEAALHYASKLDSLLVEVNQAARMTGSMMGAQHEYDAEEVIDFLHAIMQMNLTLFSIGAYFSDARNEENVTTRDVIWVERDKGALTTTKAARIRSDIMQELDTLSAFPGQSRWMTDIPGLLSNQTSCVTYACSFAHIGSRIGVIVLQIPMVLLRTCITQRANTHLHFALFSEQGRIVDSSSNWDLTPSDTETDNVGIQALWDSMAYGLRQGSTFHTRQYDRNDKEYWLFAAPVRVSNWVLLTGIPKDQALFPAKHQARIAALVMLGSLVLIVICVWNLSGLLTRPLRQLTAAVKAFTDGKPLTALQTDSSDEAGALSRSFLTMVQRLEERDLALHEARATNLGRIAEGLRGKYFYFACTTDGCVAHVSPSLEGILGFSPDEYLQQNVKFPARNFSTANGGRQEPSAYELEMRHKDGSLRRIEFFTVPVKDTRGEISGLEGMGHDITDRVNDSDKFYSLLEASPDAMVICSPKGMITMVNSRTEDLFDYPRKALLGESVMKLAPARLHGKHPIFQGESNSKMIASSHGFEFAGLTRHDDEFPVEVTINPIQTDAGMQIACAIRDVSDRKRADEALRQSEERYRRLVEGLQQAYFFYSHDIYGRYSYVTPSVKRILGYSQQEYMEGARGFLTANSMNRVVYENSRALSRGGKRPAYYCEMTHADGSKRILEIFEVAALDSQQQVSAVEGIARDVTTYKQAELEIRKARDEAEAANHAKSQFLSNMSHELRTPLNGVLGYTQIMLQGELVSVSQRENLQAIESCGQHLLTLINDILDLTKIESGGLELHWEVAELRHTLQAVHRMLKARADNKGLVFELETGTDLPETLFTDETKLRQILINLVGNAIKYTYEGKVQLAVSIQPAAAGRPDSESKAGEVRQNLILKVVDTGVGIEQQDLDVIFDPFRQLTSTREEGGTGLGLAISLRLVEALGGRLQVESNPGQGSTFIFEHPIYPIPATAPTALLSKPLDEGKNLGLPQGCCPDILVVDDSAINRDILLKLLTGAGFRVKQASDGEQALMYLREQVFDLVLLDIRMPRISGMDVIRQLRQHLKLEVPVVAVTASVNERLQHHYHELGFDAYVSKPFRAVELLEVIAELLGLKYEQHASDTSISESRSVPPNNPVATSCSDLHWLDMLGQAIALGDIEAAGQAADKARQYGHAEDAEYILQLCRSVDMDQLETFYLSLREKYISL
ncbi:PAS domain S-box protein [Spongorhabdus nitratireducens]